jgi:Arc/MetJ-type ribon-helix-helix transcriptional regulator
MVPIAAKIPEGMYKELISHIGRNTHSSLSELIRDALREWMEKHGLLEVKQ